MPSTSGPTQNSRSLNAISSGLLMRTTTSAPARRTRLAAPCTSLRAFSFSAAGTLSSRSSWMQSAPRVCALSTYFSTLTGTYSSERQTGRSGFTGDDAFFFQVLDFRNLEAKRFQDFLVVLAQLRRRAADRPWRALQARHHGMHWKLPHVGVRVVREQLALEDVRVLDNLRHVVDRADGDLRLLEKRDVLRLRACGDEGPDDGIELRSALYALRVGLVARVAHQVLAPDGAKRAFGHFLRRGRQADIQAVLAAIDVARRGVGRAAARARLDFSREPVVGRLRTDDGKQRIEQRQ